jgi:hypothetical protein
MVVEPAAIPVGVVNTKEWLDEVLTLADESVSETLVRRAADAVISPSDDTRAIAAALIKN